eukprot:1424787-Prymnesium_polylepis.1
MCIRDRHGRELQPLRARLMRQQRLDGAFGRMAEDAHRVLAAAVGQRIWQRRPARTRAARGGRARICGRAAERDGDLISCTLAAAAGHYSSGLQQWRGTRSTQRAAMRWQRPCLFVKETGGSAP